LKSARKKAILSSGSCKYVRTAFFSEIKSIFSSAGVFETMRCIAFSFIMFSFLTLRAAPEELYGLETLITGENIALLVKKAEISRLVTEDGKLLLFPAVPRMREMSAQVSAMKPTIGYEILKLAKIPERGCGRPSCILEIYNLLRAISTLKGIEYYSASRKRMRIFYEDARVVDSADSRNPLPDPHDETIPDKSTIFGFFKDSSFGEYVCSIEYERAGPSVSMRMQNVTQIWYLFFPIIEPNKMLSYILIIPTDSGILFYGFSCIKGQDSFGIAASRADSLYNRLIALYNWFERRFRR
jgi:hypothetical protein